MKKDRHGWIFVQMKLMKFFPHAAEGSVLCVVSAAIHIRRASGCVVEGFAREPATRRFDYRDRVPTV